MTTEEQEQRARARLMRGQGASIHEIARALDLRPGWVRGVVRHFEGDGVRDRRISDLRAQIRVIDDPDAPWDVDELLDALEVMSIERTAIVRHYDGLGMGTVSLRAIMDLTISEEVHPKPGFLLSPFLGCRCGGIQGFWRLVLRLTEPDIGRQTNQLWRRKLAKLSDCSRIVAPGQYSWSKPCAPPAAVEAALSQLVIDLRASGAEQS